MQSGKKKFQRERAERAGVGVLYLKQQVVLEDSLDRLQQVGAQRQRALEGGLPIPEELGQSFAPHAVGQRSH